MTDTTAIELTGRLRPGYEAVLSAEALAFVARLAEAFEGRRQELLAQ